MRRLLVAGICAGMLSGCDPEYGESTSNSAYNPAPDTNSPLEAESDTHTTDDAGIPQSVCPARLPWVDIEDSEEAPISLTASDGTGLVFRKLRARAVVEGPFAFTELFIEFENPENRVIEGRFEVVLPSCAAISRFAMRIGDKWQEAEVVEKQAARVAYEDFLHRNRDPALLEKSAGNRFRARVFPISPREKKQFILSYSETLTDPCAPYRLTLWGLPKIGELEVDVNTGDGNHFVHRERDATPQSNITVLPESPSLDSGVRFEDFVAARITPTIERTEAKVEQLTVLFDTSFSRRPGLIRSVESLKEVISALLDHTSMDFRLRIFVFDQSTDLVFEGPASAFDERARDAIRERGAMGASNLEEALNAAARRPMVNERLLIFSDGIPSAGRRAPEALRQTAAALGLLGVSRIDVVADAIARDDIVLRALTHSGLEHSGVVMDSSRSPEEIALHLETEVFADLSVRVPGARWVWPDKVKGLQQGESILVYAALPENEEMRIVMEDIGFDRVVPLKATKRPLLERAFVQANIDRMQSMIGGQGENDAVLKEEIVDLSVTHRVLSDDTALLVLETEADFARFHIDRKALADILTVGRDGIDVLRRTDAVISGRGGSQGLLFGDVIGESFGYGGLGTSGTGRGGGGYGAGTVLLRSAGSIGLGEGGGRGVQRRAGVPMCRPGAALVQGTLSKDVVKRIIDRHKNELRSCYNQALLTDPVLEAKVVVRFVISRTGEVAHADVSGPGTGRLEFDQCIEGTILGWSFPTALGGGIVIVTYPVQFSTTEQSGEEVLGPAVPGVAEKDRFLTMIEESLADNAQEDAAAAVARMVDEVIPPIPAERVDVPRRTPPIGDIDRTPSSAASTSLEHMSRTATVSETDAAAEEKVTFELPQPENAYTGVFAAVRRAMRNDDNEGALFQATRWFEETDGSVLSIIALGEVFEARGEFSKAARAYGSIIDQSPSRAEMLRTAGGRLERLGGHGLSLAVDAYENAVRERPDHPTGYRLLAYALLKVGESAGAFEVLRRSLAQKYPNGRFAGVRRILKEDAALVGAALSAAQPEQAQAVAEALKQLHIREDTRPSTRFVLSWETDANDVDLHVFDGRKNHVFYERRALESGGVLYDDVTTGLGPECMTIRGNPRAYPYRLQAHYYNRGPMGFGMGKLQIVRHDGKGGLSFSERPFVIMQDNAYVNLGTLRHPGDLTPL